ncbi:5-oxoprolinase subunit PxpB [Nocardioides sp. AX2bis]|uniref:5-oxoprolinase subunit PxpB n=1 Tax=Nocardioides sp. AX2bis TaxID=2653157 RepID=UPI0012F10308|nr:5-oxoprolinase subunit PxpB [Nocardioides sp. AX2bis]VXB22125.1 putative hydrolase subunit [Nocardioides sp. AX2bis]
MRVRAYGDRAVLVELASTQEAVDWAAGLAALLGSATDAGRVEQVVPAARSVLVVARDGVPVADVRRLLDRVEARTAAATEEAEVLEVPTVYDGEDLAAVASLTGLTQEQVVAAHTGQTWRVAFAGFAPGFGYLLGEDDRLHVPRRDEPRTRVPAGSVGLAGAYSGIYPTASPGGWQLLGRTDLVLWDVDRDPPALLRPGVRVRFVDVGHRSGGAGA